MKSTLYQAGHTCCATCLSTFPSSWFQNRGAVRKDGHSFCSQKCVDNYKPEGGHTQLWLSIRSMQNTAHAV